jgi:DNA-binding response OmpR family regulator
MHEFARKLLIIEDDPIIAHIYRSKFEKEGYEVEVASDGQTGFYRLFEAPFNAVILDLMLPQINGLDILKKIRAQRNFERLPVIVLTNAYLSQMALEAARAGASHVFYKATTSAQEIINAINRLLFLPMPGTGGSAPSAGGPQLRMPPGVSRAPVGMGSEFSSTLSESETPPATWPPTPGLPYESPRGPAAVPTPESAFGSADASSENEILTAFMQLTPVTVGTLRRIVQCLTKDEDQQAKLQHLQELFQRIHSLAANANLAGLRAIPQVGAVFEAFLQELCANPDELNASTLQTAAKTIDFLGLLLQKGPTADPAEPLQAYILCVDDDPLSLRASTFAVERANLRSLGVEDPQVALKLLECTPFDMVITDIDMPGMNGFELCSKLRTLPAHKNTPVIFVTALADFDSRALSVISGGNDLIAKPVMLMELAVKVIVYVVRASIAKMQG